MAMEALKTNSAPKSKLNLSLNLDIPAGMRRLRVVDDHWEVDARDVETLALRLSTLGAASLTGSGSSSRGRSHVAIRSALFLGTLQVNGKDVRVLKGAAKA
jgi:hypothetical protein